jgi:hypothetical protein
MKINIGLATLNSSKIVCARHHCDVNYNVQTTATEPLDVSNTYCLGLNAVVQEIVNSPSYRTALDGAVNEIIQDEKDACTLSWELEIDFEGAAVMVS